MSEEVQRHFEQAAECIEDARVLLDNNRLAAAVTRVYYAMFHAATAALLAKGIRRSSHHALLAAFGQNLVKTGELDQRFYRNLRAAFQQRQQADYEAVLDIDRQAAVRLYEQAIDFIDA
ncbi:MAG TPA: HEPN domain-containing protein [Sedimentisphaerales bacterium]|nr:HEPN domain-containing protein [Sedimentisphaerales bacterium]